jgi:hypothetical protein
MSKMEKMSNNDSNNDSDSEEEETLIQELANDVVDSNSAILAKLVDADSDEDSDCEPEDCYQHFVSQTSKEQVKAFLRARLIKRIKLSYMEYVRWTNDDTLSQIDADVDELLENDEPMDTEDAIKQVLQDKSVLLDKAIAAAIEVQRDGDEEVDPNE